MWCYQGDSGENRFEASIGKTYLLRASIQGSDKKLSSITLQTHFFWQTNFQEVQAGKTEGRYW